MIANVLTGEPQLPPKALAQQEAEFTAEGAPPPGHTSGTSVPDGTGATPSSTPSIFIDEWDMLMIAIQDRLRRAVSGLPQQGHDGGPEPVRACVLECVQALHQLHVLLLHAGPRPGSGERLGRPRGTLRVGAQER